MKDDIDRYIALLNAEIADNGLLRDEIERLHVELEKIARGVAPASKIAREALDRSRGK